MLSRFTDKTDELLIQQSKTQRLTILQEQYQMKQQALQKATDLIALLSDQLQIIKSSSSKNIQILTIKLNESEHKNRILEKRLKQFQDLISYKQSRIIGVLPLSRRSWNGDKRGIKQRIEEQALPIYANLHIDFLKNLTNALLTKIFQTHKATQYVLNTELDFIQQEKVKIREFNLEISQFDYLASENGLKDKCELFEIIQEQQQIINKLKNYINNLQVTHARNPKGENSLCSNQSIDNLVKQLKILMDIVTQSIRSKSSNTRSTDYRMGRCREIETPYQYIAKMEALSTKEKYLTAENKELKNIIEGLITHIKR